MSTRTRTVLKVLLSILLGLLCLPFIVYGVYLWVCFVRIHTTAIYYVDYQYGVVGLVWLLLGLLNFWLVLYAIWRRSFYGMLFLAPVFVFLVATEIHVDNTPHTSSLGADVTCISRVNSLLDSLYRNDHKFPASEAELITSITADCASRYRQRGKPLPYELVLVKNADGPRLKDTSPRPGVIYYHVSKDLQEYWVTMTWLQSDLAWTAHVESAPGLSPEFWLFHSVRRDDPAKNP
jgi:hypothetical protein